MMAPTPGIRPSTKPTTVPRPMAPQERRHSSRLGQQRPQLAAIACAARALGREQDLADPEQAHDHRDEADAVVEVRDAEGEARGAAHGVDAEHRQQQAQHGHEERGQEDAPCETDDQAKSQQHEGEELRRPEAEGDSRQRQRRPR